MCEKGCIPNESVQWGSRPDRYKGDHSVELRGNVISGCGQWVWPHLVYVCVSVEVLIDPGPYCTYNNTK